MSGPEIVCHTVGSCELRGLSHGDFLVYIYRIAGKFGWCKFSYKWPNAL